MFGADRATGAAIRAPTTARAEVVVVGASGAATGAAAATSAAIGADEGAMASTCAVVAGASRASTCSIATKKAGRNGN